MWCGNKKNQRGMLGYTLFLEIFITIAYFWCVFWRVITLRPDLCLAQNYSETINIIQWYVLYAMGYPSCFSLKGWGDTTVAATIFTVLFISVNNSSGITITYYYLAPSFHFLKNRGHSSNYNITSYNIIVIVYMAPYLCFCLSNIG